MRARTGLVTLLLTRHTSSRSGWGVGRQVVRVLRDQGVDDPAGILDRLPEVAEAEGFIAYAVFEGRTATAAALVELPSGR